MIKVGDYVILYHNHPSIRGSWKDVVPRKAIKVLSITPWDVRIDDKQGFCYQKEWLIKIDDLSRLERLVYGVK